MRRANIVRVERLSTTGQGAAMVHRVRTWQATYAAHVAARTGEHGRA